MSVLDELRRHADELTPDPPRPLPHWSAHTRRSLVRNWPMVIEHIRGGKSLGAIARARGVSRGAIFIQATRAAGRWLEWKRDWPNQTLPCTVLSASETAALQQIRQYGDKLPTWAPEPPRDWKPREKLRYVRGWLLLKAHVTEGLTLREIAKKFQMSPEGAYKLIKWTASRATAVLGKLNGCVDLPHDSCQR